MMPGAIIWCSICNAKPATGKLTLLHKSTNEEVPYDACTQCVEDIMAGKVDWIENGIMPS